MILLTSVNRNVKQDVNVVLDVSDLPSVPQGLVREFEVVKVHNGVAIVLKVTDNGN